MQVHELKRRARDVAFSPNGKILACQFGSWCHFYDVATGEDVKSPGA